MKASRPLLFGLAMPLFVAPLSGCPSNKDADGTADSDTDTDTDTDADTDTDTDTDADSDTDSDTDADTSDTAPPTPVCSDGLVEADQICFDAGTSHDGHGAVTALAVGDLDGGGNDVVYAVDQQVRFLAGDGTGLSGANTLVQQRNDPTSDLVVGHLDDGTDLDIIAGYDVLFGDGTGGVAAADRTFGEGARMDLHVADVVGSGGSQDYTIFYDHSNGGVQITLGVEGPGFGGPDLSGFEGAEGALAQTGAARTSLVWVQSTNYAATATLSHVPLAVAYGEIITDPRVDTPIEGAGARLAPGDLTGDGFDEVAVIVAPDAVNVLVSDGADGWVDQGGVDYRSHAVGAGPDDIAMGDLDGDGDLDVVVTHPSADSLTVLVNDGAGALTSQTLSLAAGAAPTRVAVGDLNGDNVDDIVVTTTAPDDVTVLLSDP